MGEHELCQLIKKASHGRCGAGLLDVRTGAAAQGSAAAGAQESIGDDGELWVLAGKKRQELVAVDSDDTHGKIQEDDRRAEQRQLVLGFDGISCPFDEAAFGQALQQGLDAGIPEEYGIFDKEQPYVPHVCLLLPVGAVRYIWLHCSISYLSLERRNIRINVELLVLDGRIVSRGMETKIGVYAS